MLKNQRNVTIWWYNEGSCFALCEKEAVKGKIHMSLYIDDWKRQAAAEDRELPLDVKLIALDMDGTRPYVHHLYGFPQSPIRLWMHYLPLL